MKRAVKSIVSGAVIGTVIGLVSASMARPIERPGQPRGHYYPPSTDGGACLGIGEAVACADNGPNAQCCSGYCQIESNDCCSPLAVACTGSNECCSLSCTDGVCEPGGP